MQQFLRKNLGLCYMKLKIIKLSLDKNYTILISLKFVEKTLLFNYLFLK
jgi:hypothetical protein